MRPPDPYTARPATVGDAPAAAALVHAVDSVHLAEPDQMEGAELAGWWARLDLPSSSLLVLDAGGDLAAYGDLDSASDGVLELDGYVHPDHTGRGVGAFLLAWAEQEARRRGRGTLRTSVLSADSAATRLLENRGLRPVRHFYRMLIDFDEPPPPPVWPDGFEVSTLVPGEEEVLHAVIEEAFADHWGYQRHDLDHWQVACFGQDWWDPSLVYLVRERGEVVAAEINAIRFGMGWIGSLGTRQPWRGRGLGRALLHLAFGELHRRGEHRVGLGVDAGNETGATRLYESAGMRVAWQADVYEKRM